MSVFRNLDCLSLAVCSNTTLLKLQTVLFLFFSKFCAPKSGVRLIYGCGLYTDVYGTYVFVAFEWNQQWLWKNCTSFRIILQYFKVVKDDGIYWVIVRVKCKGEWNSDKMHLSHSRGILISLIILKNTCLFAAFPYIRVPQTAAKT